MILVGRPDCSRRSAYQSCQKKPSPIAFTDNILFFRMIGRPVGQREPSRLMSDCLPTVNLYWHMIDRFNSSKRYKFSCEPVEDSDQPASAHPRCLIRNFKGRSMCSHRSNISQSDRQILGWGCADWFEYSLFVHTYIARCWTNHQNPKSSVDRPSLSWNPPPPPNDNRQLRRIQRGFRGSSEPSPPPRPSRF